MDEKEFDFKLTEKDVSTILTGLGNLPYVQSTGLINKLSKTYADQKNRTEAATEK